MSGIGVESSSMWAQAGGYRTALYYQSNQLLKIHPCTHHSLRLACLVGAPAAEVWLAGLVD